MGGDHAPGAIVQGAINAARKGLAGHPGRRRGARARRARAASRRARRCRSRCATPPRWSRCTTTPARRCAGRSDNSIRVCFELVKAGRGERDGVGGQLRRGDGGRDLRARPARGRRAAGDHLGAARAARAHSLLLDMGAVVDCKPHPPRPVRAHGRGLRAARARRRAPEGRDPRERRGGVEGHRPHPRRRRGAPAARRSTSSATARGAISSPASSTSSSPTASPATWR